MRLQDVLTCVRMYVWVCVYVCTCVCMRVYVHVRVQVMRVQDVVPALESFRIARIFSDATTSNGDFFTLLQNFESFLNICHPTYLILSIYLTLFLSPYLFHSISFTLFRLTLFSSDSIYLTLFM